MPPKTQARTIPRLPSPALCPTPIRLRLCRASLLAVPEVRRKPASGCDAPVSDGERAASISARVSRPEKRTGVFSVTVAFRGFKGRYRVNYADASGAAQSAEFHLAKDGDGL